MTGTKNAAMVRQGIVAKSSRAVVRNSSAGMNTWNAALDSTRAASLPDAPATSHFIRPAR